jgi:hypothetical protein
MVDSGGSLAKRMILWHFRRSFYGKEDHKLTDKLLPELTAFSAPSATTAPPTPRKLCSSPARAGPTTRPNVSSTSGDTTQPMSFPVGKTACRGMHRHRPARNVAPRLFGNHSPTRCIASRATQSPSTPRRTSVNCDTAPPRASCRNSDDVNGPCVSPIVR